MPLLNRQVSFQSAFSKALGQWAAPEATEENKLRLRLAIAFNSDVRDAIRDYLLAKNELEAERVFGSIWDGTGIDVDKLEKFLALVVKYLPLLLEIIHPLFI